MARSGCVFQRKLTSDSDTNDWELAPLAARATRDEARVGAARPNYTAAA